MHAPLPNNFRRSTARLSLLLCLFLSMAYANVAIAEDLERAEREISSGIIWPSAPADIEAKAWILLDANSNTVLASHDEHRQLEPASLTKMMTLYLLFEALQNGDISMSDTVNISKKAWKIGGSTMFLEPRHKPTIKQIMSGIATLSGNDASIAFAEHLAGSETAFVARMNAKAVELGLQDTHFINATGFPAEGHLSSPWDMAYIGLALWRDFSNNPEYYAVFSESDFTFNGIKQNNRNRLLWQDKRIDGIKTGHTAAAGFCLVSSGQQGNIRLVAAVFGAKSDADRAKQSRRLLDYGFRYFNSLRPAEQDLRRQVEIYQGVHNKVWLAPKHTPWITIPRGYEKHIAFRLHYSSPLLAPIKKGQESGYLEAVLMYKQQPETVIRHISLLAMSDVETAGWFGRQWDAMRLWWKKYIITNSGDNNK
ncbi:MAG: D-alanyl-D-alanine carboxypeptidase family protein [Mariprofundales bacterium]